MIGGPVQPGFRQSQDPYSTGQDGRWEGAAEQTRFLQQVLANFGVSLLVASLGAFLAWQLPPAAFLPLVVVEFVLLLAVVFARRSARVGPVLLYAFALVSGATTVPLLLWAIGTTGGTAVIYNALGVSGSVFCAMAWYGYTAKRDLSGWGPFLMIGLIGSLVASFVGIFITRSTGFELLISTVIVITFTGFVAYDLNQIKAKWREYDVTTATLTLYLDFLNLFTAILRILAILNGGGRRD